MLFRMNRNEFLDLWKQQKSIVDEVRFERSRTYANVYEFEDVRVLADFPGEILVAGTYERLIGAVRYTFWIKGLGPIIRYCIGGTEHAGTRFHQHELRTLDCSRRNLPFTIPRDDMRGWTAKQVWYQVLKEGNITHTETFYEPEALCA